MKSACPDKKSGRDNAIQPEAGLGRGVVKRMAKAEAWAPLFFAGAGRAKRPWLVFFMKEVCF